VSTNAEQAAAHQRLADRAFARADRHAAQDNERAEIKAIQEGRREQAIAERYRTAAAGEQS
jgi:hypothetical protein